MYDDYHYPAGVDNENAPWNKENISEKEFSLTCCQTLSKTVTVLTTDYELETDTEPEEGYLEEIANTEDTSWSDVYAENEYHTPLQLINLFKRYLEYLIDSSTPVPLSPSFLKHLKDECDDWVEDECDFLEE